MEREVKKERFKITPSVYIILLRNNQIYLQRRANTGYKDGELGFPAGHKEKGETPAEATIREGEEETGVLIKTPDIEFAHIMFRTRIPGSERADIFFLIRKFEGEPYLKEEKADQDGWFELNELPENMIDYHRVALECYLKGVIYSEYDESTLNIL